MRDAVWISNDLWVVLELRDTGEVLLHAWASMSGTHYSVGDVIAAVQRSSGVSKVITK